jgi:hypothetical protein
MRVPGATLAASGAILQGAVDQFLRVAFSLPGYLDAEFPVWKAREEFAVAVHYALDLGCQLLKSSACCV